MAPVKEEDDPVIAEYNVFLTPPLEEQVYLMQYPNRIRQRPYNSKYGATPREMRIKPQSGFVELDVRLNTEQNFNKYMGLKWGDATRSSYELHNASGTYGPAAGVAPAKARSAGRQQAIKGQNDRELEIDNDLRAFKEAVQDDKVHAKQTLGGQITRHDAEAEAGKPFYFIGVFNGDHMHLTKVDGTVQLRPNFHHVDAEQQRERITAHRVQAAEAPPVAPAAARGVGKIDETQIDKNTVEYKLFKALEDAGKEEWVKMKYVDDEDDAAYDAFAVNLMVNDTASVPHLKSDMDNDAYLNAIGAARHGSPTRRKKRQPKNKASVELEEDDDMEDAHSAAEA